MHAESRLQARDAVGGHGVVDVVVQEFVAVGIAAGKVEEINACEDDKEAREKGKGVYGVSGVETLEEDERGAKGGGCEGHVVEGVDSAVGISSIDLWNRQKPGRAEEGAGLHRGRKLAKGFIEIIHLR